MVHAQGADHLAVLRGRPYQGADLGFPEHGGEEEEHGRAGEDEEQVVGRIASPEHFHGPAEPGRLHSEDVVAAEGDYHQVRDDEHGREGGDELVEFRRTVHATKDKDLENDANNSDRQGGDYDAAPEAQRGVERGNEARDQRGCEVGSQHVERAVREVDDPGDAEDQRQTARSDEQRGRGSQPVQRLNHQERCVQYRLSMRRFPSAGFASAMPANRDLRFLNNTTYGRKASYYDNLKSVGPGFRTAHLRQVNHLNHCGHSRRSCTSTASLQPSRTIDTFMDFIIIVMVTFLLYPE